MSKAFLDKDENLFSYVVDTFRSSASISMGKIEHPVTKKIDINLDQAEYYLDILSMLQKKTKNNLTEYEEQMLINIVSELKMNFIEVKQSIENVNGTSLSMKKNKKNSMISPRYININRILAVATFLISFIVYFDTMAPSVSYWDCGEFIAVSYTLGVPHPPGSPLFLLLGRIASMMPISEDIAFRVNLLSPLVSAFAVLFLYFIIVQFVSHWRGKINSNTDALIAFGAGIVGSLTFAFTDSHWFNAVEAEVYAFSTFFTAIVVWLALLWSEKADEQGNERYILIISYMIGLATGLHLLNLLTIPFVALLIYFRKFKFEWTSFGILIVLTGLVFFIIHNVIIKGMPKIADAIGVSLTGLLIISIFGGMVWAVLNHKKLTSIILTSMVLILIGYSTYALIFIRSNQDPGIDENDPETVEAFISYLEREQYGDVGILPRRFQRYQTYA